MRKVQYEHEQQLHRSPSEVLRKFTVSDPSITSIDLSSCKLSDKHAKLMAPLFSKKNCLVEVNLSSNSLKNEGIREFLKALERIPTLKHIRIENNKTDSSLLPFLEEFLSTNYNIVTFESSPSSSKVRELLESNAELSKFESGETTRLRLSGRSLKEYATTCSLHERLEQSKLMRLERKPAHCFTKGAVDWHSSNLFGYIKEQVEEAVEKAPSTSESKSSGGIAQHDLVCSNSYHQNEVTCHARLVFQSNITFSHRHCGNESLLP
eukprot:TRINITY_DN7907_c0_g1_i1.p1 TRINITY_DN7907_c0_g1~~TRINITY_DN7907_c0_g1_i1.p1  ORF type:complete len:265 (-),score=48.99 TRINITY_DN7907_c0_g1_i1:118-912(-)